MKQTVSELIDSELEESAARHAIAAIEADDTLAEAWHDYHLIGDAMRGERFVSLDVRAALAPRLAREPTVLAPRHWRGRVSSRTTGLVALAASFGFAAVISWQHLSGPMRGGALLAAVNNPSGASAQLVAGNPDAYFLAHQELTADQGLVKVSYGQGAAH